MKNTKHGILNASFIFVLFSGSWASADSIVIRASRDTTIYKDDSGKSNGAGDFLFAGRNGGGSARRSLLAFDLTKIPKHAVINKVTITLQMSKTGSAAANVNLHRLLSNWGEKTSDAPGGEGGGTAAAGGDATWENNFFPDGKWTAAGGDYQSAPTATQSVDKTGQYSWSSQMLVKDVRAWVNGDQKNFGWAIIGDESKFSTTKRFNSRTNTTGSPTLTIEFTIESGANVESPESVINTWAASFDTNDHEKIAQFYDRSPNTEMVVSAGGRYVGFDAIQAEYEKAAKEVRYYDSSAKKLNARSFGETALVTFEHIFKVHMMQDEVRLQGHVRTSTVLQRIDGGWKIIHEHSSPIKGIERMVRIND